MYHKQSQEINTTHKRRSLLRGPFSYFLIFINNDVSLELNCDSYPHAYFHYYY